MGLTDEGYSIALSPSLLVGQSADVCNLESDKKERTKKSEQTGLVQDNRNPTWRRNTKDKWTRA